MIASEVKPAESKKYTVAVPLAPEEFYKTLRRIAAREDTIDARVAENLADLLEGGGERLIQQFEILKKYYNLQTDSEGEPNRETLEETNEPFELELLITTDAALRTLGQQNKNYPADENGFYSYTEQARRSARFFLEASWVRKQLYLGAEEFLQVYEKARAKLAGKETELEKLLGEAARAGKPAEAKEKLGRFLAGLPHPEGLVINYSERQFVLPVAGGVYATTIPYNFSLHLVSRGGIEKIAYEKFDSFLAAYLKYVGK